LTGIDAPQVEEYLNKGAISEDLNNRFTNKGFQLSTNATSNNEFLFSWSNVHINSERLRWFLEDDFEIGWAKDAKILIFDPSKTIRIFEDEKLVEIMINEKKEKAILKSSDGRTLDLKVKKENGKLNIYKNDKWIITDRRNSYIVRKEKGKLNIYEKCEDIDRNKKIVNVLSEYKNQVIMNLKDQNLSKAEAEKIGKELFNTLIPSEIITRLRNKLKNKSSKVEWWVWIYCDFDDFNPLWEWLYTAPSNDTAPKTSNVATQKNADENSSCLKKVFSRLLEWLQNRENKLSPESRVQHTQDKKENGFFWGDRFFLVRVPKNYKFQELEFGIENVGILKDTGCHYACRDREHLENLCGLKPKEIELNDFSTLEILYIPLFSWDDVPKSDGKKLLEFPMLLRFLKDYFDSGWAENAELRRSGDGKTICISNDKNFAKIINGSDEKATLIIDDRTYSLKVKKVNGKLNIYYIFDYIHVVANKKTSKKGEYLRSIDLALDKKNKNSLEGNDINNPCFLFLNICGCNSLMHSDGQNIQSKLAKLISADTCVETSLDFKDDFAPIFAKYFYKEFCSRENNLAGAKYVAEAITKAREKIEEEKKNGGYNSLLRLAYVVRGNPCAKVIWTQG
jgi:hypothetical protein